MNNRDAPIQSSKIYICHMLIAGSILIMNFVLCILMHIIGLSSAHMFPISTWISGNLNRNSVTKTVSASLEMTEMKISQNSLNVCMAERV